MTLSNVHPQLHHRTSLNLGPDLWLIN